MKTADKPGIIAAEVVHERHEKENDTRKQDVLILLRNSAVTCCLSLKDQPFFYASNENTEISTAEESACWLALLDF